MITSGSAWYQIRDSKYEGKHRRLGVARLYERELDEYGQDKFEVVFFPVPFDPESPAEAFRGTREELLTRGVSMRVYGKPTRANKFEVGEAMRILKYVPSLALGVSLESEADIARLGSALDELSR